MTATQPVGRPNDGPDPRALVDETLVADFDSDGVVHLAGVFDAWVDILARGIERNVAEPGPYASENTRAGDSGRFFDDYCNWARIPEYRDFVLHSPAAELAAHIMGSRSAQFFHEHVLVKEAGTCKHTPWHQDLPYYCVDGAQTVSMWIALDRISRDASLRCVAGSHRWAKLLRPSHWLDDSDFYKIANEQFMDLPDIDGRPDEFPVLTWAMEPGDAILFSYRTVHGAPGNEGSGRRRAFSARWVGDDARYLDRPGRTSPPYPGIGQTSGERLREDWFPVVYRS